jgi:hypothetical protein
LDSAASNFTASYLWGYAGTGFGPYRAARVIRFNTDPEQGKDFSAELHRLAQIAITDGGNAAFEHIVNRRRSDRRFFVWWGPPLPPIHQLRHRGVRSGGHHLDHGQRRRGMVSEALQGGQPFLAQLEERR